MQLVSRQAGRQADLLTLHIHINISRASSCNIGSSESVAALIHRVNRVDGEAHLIEREREPRVLLVQLVISTDISESPANAIWCHWRQVVLDREGYGERSPDHCNH